MIMQSPQLSNQARNNQALKFVQILLYIGTGAILWWCYTPKRVK